MASPNDQEVALASFSTGWLISQLHGPILRRPENARGPLPTVNELSRNDRVQLTFLELNNLVDGSLQSVIGPNSAQETSKLMSEMKATWNSKSLGDVDSLCADLEKLHVCLLEALTVANHQYGTAYILGRTLSDTCWLPKSRDNLNDQFNQYRIANIQGWLSDTESAFPQFSARVVSLGLHKWVIWISRNKDIDWKQHGSRVESALRVQGERWRALLSGDKDTASLLTPDAYVSAAEVTLVRAAHILWRVAVRFWALLLFGLVLTAFWAYLSVHYSTGTAKFWTFLVSVGTGLGVTGKGIQLTAKRLALSAGKSLFSSSEEDVIAVGSTWLPDVKQKWTSRRILRRQGVVIRPLDGHEKERNTDVSQ